VKNNFAFLKATHPQLKHGEIMRELSDRYKRGTREGGMPSVLIDEEP